RGGAQKARGRFQRLFLIKGSFAENGHYSPGGDLEPARTGVLPYKKNTLDPARKRREGFS
ncbi:MAG: hypothetical protein JXA25_10375, partial [Anaerolineales bacterium]|nr:hypothetical protein [Anaerolineales bacterium]